MATARKRLEILQPLGVDEVRSQRARECFRFIVASQWKLGEARFSVVEVGGRTEFRAACGRPMGHSFAFSLNEVRAALVADFGVRRGWLRTQRPLDEVIDTSLEGERVALRLHEDPSRRTLGVEFLVPRDDTRAPEPRGTGRFSL
jgi:hypothetical protein